MHMVMPMDATAVIIALQAGGSEMLGDLAPDEVKKRRRAVETEEERKAAEASMSSRLGVKDD